MRWEKQSLAITRQILRNQLVALKVFNFVIVGNIIVFITIRVVVFNNNEKR